MLKLQTVNRLSTAQEIRDQTLKEAQEISTALIAAEQRIGELLLAIPKSSGQYAESENRPVSKNTIVSEMGYSKDEASDYQRMAQNPEVVQKVIEDALAKGEVVTKTAVMKEIKALKDQITDLKSQEPRTITVEPSDYNKLKKKAKEAEAWKADYERESIRRTEALRKTRELENKIAELQRATEENKYGENLSENIFYFCALCNNFISNVGGLVWLTEKIAEMPEAQKDMFMKAARAFMDWSSAFKDNLERSIYDKERTDTGIPLLTD